MTTRVDDSSVILVKHPTTRIHVKEKLTVNPLYQFKTNNQRIS